MAASDSNLPRFRDAGCGKQQDARFSFYLEISGQIQLEMQYVFILVDGHLLKRTADTISWFQVHKTPFAVDINEIAFLESKQLKKYLTQVVTIHYAY